MMIHVLGSDIPHHNTTVLRFFNDVLAAELPGRPVFWVVSAESPGEYPNLDLIRYPDRRRLATAARRSARRDRTITFFLHGQFSPRIWLALLTGAIRPHQAHWHIWGADLYEAAAGPRAALYYRLRRIAQGRVGRVLGTAGDLGHYRRRHPRTRSTVLYFPSRTQGPDAKLARLRPGSSLTVLIGNSGDASNRHVTALRAVRERFGAQTRVVLPCGYPAGNETYLREIRAEAHRLFPPGNVRLLTDLLDYRQYADLLAECDLGYLIFRRQQGIGTLSMLIRAQVPFVLSQDNPFLRDLTEQRVPVLVHEDRITPAEVERSRRQLAALHWAHLSFTPENCVPGWLRALTEGASDAGR